VFKVFGILYNGVVSLGTGFPQGVERVRKINSEGVMRI
jgi:hypothetical protein